MYIKYKKLNGDQIIAHGERFDVGFTRCWSCQSVFVWCEFDTFLVLLSMDVVDVIYQNMDKNVVVFSRCWCLQLVFDCIFQEKIQCMLAQQSPSIGSLKRIPSEMSRAIISLPVLAMRNMAMMTMLFAPIWSTPQNSNSQSTGWYSENTRKLQSLGIQSPSENGNGI